MNSNTFILVFICSFDDSCCAAKWILTKKIAVHVPYIKKCRNDFSFIAGWRKSGKLRNCNNKTINKKTSQVSFLSFISSTLFCITIWMRCNLTLGDSKLTAIQWGTISWGAVAYFVGHRLLMVFLLSLLFLKMKLVTAHYQRHVCFISTLDSAWQWFIMNVYSEKVTKIYAQMSFSTHFSSSWWFYFIKFFCVSVRTNCFSQFHDFD